MSDQHAVLALADADAQRRTFEFVNAQDTAGQSGWCCALDVVGSTYSRWASAEKSVPAHRLRQILTRLAKHDVLTAARALSIFVADLGLEVRPRQMAAAGDLARGAARLRREYGEYEGTVADSIEENGEAGPDVTLEELRRERKELAELHDEAARQLVRYDVAIALKEREARQLSLVKGGGRS